MRTTQKLKQEIFKEVQASGMFKEIQSKLKSEVLNLVDKQSYPNKMQMGFQYQHPLLNKLRKYPLTSLCLDLMQQFLESFKFKYTLSVFKKEINRDININRVGLANNFKIQMKNPETQAVLLSLVSQLVSGDIKIDFNKQSNAFANNIQTQNNNKNTRINNFISNEGNKIGQQTEATNFTKKPTYITPQDSSINSSLNNSANNKSSISQPQDSGSNFSSVNQSKNNKPSTSSILDDSSTIKPSQNSIPQAKQQQSQIQPIKQDKGKKGKKKKQAQKPPEGASDLMGQLMSKFKTKDVKTEEQKKNQIFEQKRAFSEEKAKKVIDPSQSGANKIRGVSAGKMSNFMNKFYNPPGAPVAKNDSYIEQQLDQFQQSKDSTRKNPLFSSSQSGFDKSGIYYDESVDSNAINDFQYVQRAKKFAKKA